MEIYNNKVCCDLLLSLLGLWLSVRLQFLSVIIMFSVLVIIDIEVWMGQNYNSDSVALSLTYSFLITSLLKDLIFNLTATERECISLERIHQYSGNKLEIGAGIGAELGAGLGAG